MVPAGTPRATWPNNEIDRQIANIAFDLTPSSAPWRWDLLTSEDNMSCRPGQKDLSDVASRRTALEERVDDVAELRDNEADRSEALVSQ